MMSWYAWATRLGPSILLATAIAAAAAAGQQASEQPASACLAVPMTSKWRILQWVERTAGLVGGARARLRAADLLHLGVWNTSATPQRPDSATLHS